MRLNPATIDAADAIVKILDELANHHSSNEVTWVAQVIAAYMASGDVDNDTGVPPVIASSAAQHVKMRRITDAFLATCQGHDIEEVLTEVLVRQGEP
jgi:hypothetical protein